MKYIKELKEWKYKKPNNEYGSKRIIISKIELEKIFNKINIPYDNVSFISSGSFGNAYLCGDNVVKITSDSKEAAAAYNLINSYNPRIVRYYNVYRYMNFYVIVMEKITPLVDYLKVIKNTDINYVWNLTDILQNNWGIITQGQYFKYVCDIYGKKNIVGIKRFLLEEIWDLYENINEFYNDLHIDNIGIKNGKLLCFDLRMPIVGKFDEPKNI